MVSTLFIPFSIAQNKVMDCHTHKQVGKTGLVAFHSQFISVEITSQSVKKDKSDLLHTVNWTA